MTIKGVLYVAALAGLAILAPALPAQTAVPARGDSGGSGSSGGSGGDVQSAPAGRAPTAAGRGGRGGFAGGGFGGASFGGSAGGGGMSGGGGISGPVGQAGPGGGSGVVALPEMGEGPTCSLDATIYEVRMPVDQIGRLDAEALTRAAASAATFEKALSELGAVKPLYRADQSVRLQGDTISIGAQMPYVTNSQVMANGQTLNSVSYTSVGAVFKIVGKAGVGADKIELDLGVQMSTMSEGTTLISEKVKAPLFRTATMAHRGTVTAKQPFVLISADAASGDENGQAVAYFARVTLGVPQGEAAAARVP